MITDTKQHPNLTARLTAKSDQPAPAKSNFRARLRLLQWLIPVGLILLVVFYEFGPAHWILDRYGLSAHSVAEILFFGTVGPTLAFLALELFSRWLDERDTSDLQAQIVAKARAREESSLRVCDDALQVLFAAGTLIETLEAEVQLPAERAAQAEVTRAALDRAIDRLRAHLLDA